MADLRISELPPMAPADLREEDQLPIADASASTTKRISGSKLVEYSLGLIPNETIPSSKLQDVQHGDISPATADGQFLAGPAASSGRLSARRIVPTDLPIATTATTGVSRVGSGLGITALGVLSVQPATNVDVGGVFVPATGGLQVSPLGGLSHSNTPLAAGTRSGITHDALGHILSTAPLAPADLPPATEDTIGAVSVPSTGGLSVTPLGAISHTRTVTAKTVSGITIDDHGHVIFINPLEGSDIPPATDTNLGAVRVAADGQLVIDSGGNLSHIPGSLSAGTYNRVTVDAFGHVREGGPLRPQDIPPLDASVITSGYFPSEFIGLKSVYAKHLADYSTGFVQEPEPQAADFIGQTWLQESSSQLRIWNGNSWYPAGFGAVQAANIRFGGTFNAATGVVTSVTALGTQSTLVVGEQIPVGGFAHVGVYLLCTEPGSGTVAAPGVEFTVGDWILSLDPLSMGWIRIDITGPGGGGGGGSVFSTLDSLTDVMINAPSQGQVLVWNNVSRQWENGAAGDPGTF